MRAVVQRVRQAEVLVGSERVGAIGAGVCVLLGVAREDGEAEARALARRVARLRVFENDAGRLDRSVLDVSGEALVVSQFTLVADTAKGNRPSFSAAAAPLEAEALYRSFCEALAAEGVRVATGRFGGRMLVRLENEGPVTIVLEG